MTVGKREGALPWPMMNNDERCEDRRRNCTLTFHRSRDMKLNPNLVTPNFGDI